MGQYPPGTVALGWIQQRVQRANFTAAACQTLTAVVAVATFAEILLRIVNQQAVVGDGPPIVVLAMGTAVLARRTGIGSEPFCAKHPAGRSGKRVLTPLQVSILDQRTQVFHTGRRPFLLFRDRGL